MSEKSVVFFEKMISDLRTEVEYYKKIAKQSGIRRLRETNELTNIIIKLKDTETKLSDAHLKLEKRVEERTKELQEANINLQKEIQEREYAEKQIIKMNEMLEDRVTERTVELERMNRALFDSMDTLRKTQDQLIQSEKHASLSNLVAGIAHEINTPVGVGLTAVSFLEEKTLTLKKLYLEGKMKRSDLDKYLDSTVDSVRIILNNLNRAADLISSFKLVAVDQYNDKSRKFQIRPYIEQILMNLRPELKKTNHIIEIDCPGDLYVHSNPGAFSQIFTNLIMNSIQHGFEKTEYGRIKVKIVVNDDGMMLTYKDDGKGMAEEDRKNVFEPFYTTKRGQGGTGLGMHIVFNLVTQTLGGTIKCKSRPGDGVMFMVHFPISIYSRVEKPPL